MNTLYATIIISFLIGLSAVIPLLLSLRARWKARGYALGYDAAYLSQQRLLDTCHARIRALHDDPDFVSDTDASTMFRAYEAEADTRLKEELKLGGLRKDLEKLVSDTAPGIQGFLDAYEKFKLIAQL